MKKLTLSLLIIATSLWGFSQSLLWKVSGKNMRSPSYLYGTIHIQDQRVFSFDSTVLKALGSCDAFAMEVLMDNIDMKQVRSMMYMPKGKTLSGMLSPSDFQKLDSLCKAKLGAGVVFLNSMKPFYLASAIQQVEFARDMNEALDLFLLKNARAQNKACYGLEKYEDQIKAIDAMKLDEQLEMLLEMLHDTTNMVSQQSDSLLNAYLAFDFDVMLNLASDESLSDNFNNALIKKRNVTMAKGFEKLARTQTLFCAIGAAHLAGDKGVVALLKKRGYQVEPVVFQWVEK